MSLFNSATRYGALAQALHWSTAFLVAAAWGLGQIGENLGGQGPRAAGMIAHVMVGLAVLSVLVVRLGWRLIDAPPPAEVTRLGTLADRLAGLAHYALLFLLLAVPLGGIGAQFARGEPLYVFGLAEIASPLTVPRETASNIKNMHETFANVLMILALLHAAASLFHHWVLRDRVMKRMWPFAN